MENYYDERSHIDKAFQNWNGSVYWVQGMRIGTSILTRCSAASGTVWYHAYEDAGYDVRGMLGQWEHNYPTSGANTTRRIRATAAKPLLK